MAVHVWYLNAFSSYDRMYGSLGAVIAFMTWVWLMSSLLIIGAEINAEIEHQTVRDTTIGPVRPLGQRGAVMADTLGRAHDAQDDESLAPGASAGNAHSALDQGLRASRREHDSSRVHPGSVVYIAIITIALIGASFGETHSRDGR
ncbi:MAG: YhjD/YihY/BrkB family envelope integrity protein [Burkholderiaceae bacterium]